MGLRDKLANAVDHVIEGHHLRTFWDTGGTFDENNEPVPARDQQTSAQRNALDLAEAAEARRANRSR